MTGQGGAAVTSISVTISIIIKFSCGWERTNWAELYKWAAKWKEIIHCSQSSRNMKAIKVTVLLIMLISLCSAKSSVGAKVKGKAKVQSSAEAEGEAEGAGDTSAGAEGDAEAEGDAGGAGDAKAAGSASVANSAEAEGGAAGSASVEDSAKANGKAKGKSSIKSDGGANGSASSHHKSKSHVKHGHSSHERHHKGSRGGGLDVASSLGGGAGGNLLDVGEKLDVDAVGELAGELEAAVDTSAALDAVVGAAEDAEVKTKLGLGILG